MITREGGAFDSAPRGGRAKPRQSREAAKRRAPAFVYAGARLYGQLRCEPAWSLRLLVQLLRHLEDLLGLVLRREGFGDVRQLGELAAVGGAVDELERLAV